MKDLIKAGFAPGRITSEDVLFIPTGVAVLDLAIGTGGIPVGFLTSIFGPSGVTKSTLLYYILENTKRLGGIPILFDQEFNFDVKRHLKYGLDPESVMVKEDIPLENLADNFELVLKIIGKLTKSENTFAIIAIDSFSATLSEGELKSGAPAIGLHSRIIRFLCRSFLGEMRKNRIGLIIISQETKKIGVTFGAEYTFLAQGALESNSFLNLRLQRRSFLKNSDVVEGIRVKATVLKNKFARPMKVCEYDFFYERGLAKLESVFDLLKANDFLVRRGSWYECADLDLRFHGRDQFSELVNSNPDFKVWCGSALSSVFEREIGLTPNLEVYGLCTRKKSTKKHMN